MLLLIAPVLCAAPLLCAAGPALGDDLRPGDKLPDCSKIPLLPITAPYRPAAHDVASLEDMLHADGVVIVHFTSPRPRRPDVFEIALVEEVSALQKAAQGVPYPCTPVAVLPFGEKGRADAAILLAAGGERPWGNARIFYEPTYPRPGLYRTFRPGSGGLGDREITTPWTYLIGPGRAILAMRSPDDAEDLYAWLQRNLPKKVVAVPKAPITNVSLPDRDTWVWPTFRRTAQGQAAAVRLPDTLPYTYLAWQARIGRTFASPVVVDETVYVNTDSSGLRAVALKTGQPLLAFSAGPSWWSSPAVAGPYVYVSSSKGTLFCLDRATFRLEWKRELNGLITSSPVISDGGLYVGSRNGAVYALDAANGELLWEFQTGGEISSSPSVAGGLVLIGSGDRSLYAIDQKTGAENWSFATGGPVDSSPSVVDDEVVFGSFDGNVYSVSLSDGTLNWRCELEGWVHSSPAVGSNTVFVGTVAVRQGETPTFNWIDRRTGERKGSFVMPDAIYSSPTVWGDAVLVGCRDYHLYAFDRNMKQTQPLWTFRTRSYVHASPVVVGDTALVAGFDGNLYALRQPKPIRVWSESDVVPRWFIAALAGQLHRETADLIERAARGDVGDELRLGSFDALFEQIRARVSRPEPPPKALPRDVPSDLPGAAFIEYALTAGLLAGYPDGTYRPNDPSTRYQFSFALSSVLGSVIRPDYAWRVLGERGAPSAQIEVRIVPPPGGARTVPGDIPRRHWAYGSLSQLAGLGLLPVDEERLFRGNRVVTLSDAAEQWNLLAGAVRVIRMK
ncbi:MAG: PQQ-binding-like beta-propeller repeat protein [Armatimonadetes bacterium]|nr:PQQ-binding-like beta-propeller repeat protein [Armatimonadota bacterium]